MNKVTVDNITIECLNSRINELRDVLNEICCTDIDRSVTEERLTVSRNLDDLIVEYMKKLGN